jgi:hypothetical protein
MGSQKATKRQGTKRAKVSDLPVKKASDVKGGGIASAVNNAVKSIGEGLTTMARKV